MNVIVLCSVLLGLSGGAGDSASALPTAEELLQRSLAHHDPRDAWSTRPIEITARVGLAERLAADRGYAERTDHIRVDLRAGRFLYRSDRGADRLEVTGDGDRFSARWNGSADIPPDVRQANRLDTDRLPFWRDYFTYVYGLPMKLRDPGARIQPTVKRTELAGRPVLSMRVTYSPEVGKDVWDFFFDPRTYALVGSRFYHDESANDGEYLVYEGEIAGPHGLRLPKTRRWYMNRDGEYIAVDEVLSLR